MQERAYSNRFDRKRSFSHPSSASACVSSSSLSSLSASESVYAYAWMENRPRSVEELRLAQRIGKIPKHGHVSDPAEKRALRILENSIRYRMVKFVGSCVCGLISVFIPCFSQLLSFLFAVVGFFFFSCFFLRFLCHRNDDDFTLSYCYSRCFCLFFIFLIF